MQACVATLKPGNPSVPASANWFLKDFCNAKAGVGTRVASKHSESGITAWRSFTREMAAKGITVQNYHLEYLLTPASKPAAQGLQLKPGTEVWRLERVRGWDDQPILYSVSWFHPRLSLKGNEDFSRPQYETLEAATATRPHHAREEFLAVPADARLVKLLANTPENTIYCCAGIKSLTLATSPLNFQKFTMSVPASHLRWTCDKGELRTTDTS